jgi:DNA-directed RNA polymerase sigma subunit (sigma70/sigma32)
MKKKKITYADSIKRQKAIIKMRGERYTYREIAARFNISEERCRQILKAKYTNKKEMRERMFDSPSAMGI